MLYLKYKLPLTIIMKKQFILLMLLILCGVLTYGQCNPTLVDLCGTGLEDFKLIKVFPVKMKKSRKGKHPEAYFSLTFNKDKVYKLSACTDSTSTGEMVIDLYGKSGHISSTYDERTGENLSGILYKCSSTASYYMTIKFTNTKENCGVCLLSFLTAEETREWYEK